MHPPLRTLLVAIGAVVTVGCSKDNPTSPQQNTTAWLQDATNRRANVGETFAYTCPANGQLYTVWGTDIYTDDSSICTAAVHAGKITRAAGGVVTILILGPADVYVGSTRNGVESLDYGQWLGSFSFP